MSDRTLRRRHHHHASSSSSSSRKSRPPHPSASPSPRRPTPHPHHRRPEKHSVKTSLKILKRCSSEPMMWRGSDGDDHQRKSCDGLWSDYEGYGGRGPLYRPHTCTDVFASSPTLTSPFSPHRSCEGYDREAKVVINVTVEGSPGPVMTLVKLGSSVEDAIKVIVDKYNGQARTPKLDKDAKSSYELHHSYFSLRSLEKSELIGDVGSRSFYLRRSGSNRSINGTSPSRPEIIPARMNSLQPIPPPPFLLPAFIARTISKIMRRTRRLWKIFLCWK